LVSKILIYLVIIKPFYDTIIFNLSTFTILDFYIFSLLSLSPNLSNILAEKWWETFKDVSQTNNKNKKGSLHDTFTVNNNLLSNPDCTISKRIFSRLVCTPINYKNIDLFLENDTPLESERDSIVTSKEHSFEESKGLEEDDSV